MKNIIYLLLVLLFVSCYDMDKPEKPDNLIAKDKMVNILFDMSILNSAKGINKRKLENKGVDLQQYVLKKHEIDSAQFANSNYYYTFRIDDYKDIYQQVEDSLNKLKDKYTAIEEAEKNKKKKKDSIKKKELKSAKKKNKPLIEISQPATSSKNRKVSRKPQKVSRVPK